MKRKYFYGAFAVLGAIPLVAHAADHLDGPAVVAEPNADITDLFAWMNGDASNVNVVLGVHPMATQASSFSSAVQYAVHFNSAATFVGMQTENVMLCRFYQASRIECWLGNEYVAGDPSDPEGLESDSGKLRVFAGLRNDPFFFNFTGFTAAVDLVNQSAGMLDFDDENCPLLTPDTQQALVSQLQQGTAGAPASDTFEGSNVLALVFEVDKTLVTQGGPVLGVWASTHAAQ